MSEVITKEQMREALSSVREDLRWKYRDSDDRCRTDVYYELLTFVDTFAKALDIDE